MTTRNRHRLPADDRKLLCLPQYELGVTTTHPARSWVTFRRHRPTPATPRASPSPDAQTHSITFAQCPIPQKTSAILWRPA